MSFAAGFQTVVFVCADRIVHTGHLRPMKQSFLHQVVDRSTLAVDCNTKLTHFEPYFNSILTHP